MCPTLQEEPIEQVKVTGGFLSQLQRKNDLYVWEFSTILIKQINLNLHKLQSLRS